MQNSDTCPTFGYYKPGNSTLFLKALTQLGAGRGPIKKWISRKWIEKGYSIVDTTVRGINYRLDIRNNTTDAKILTSSKYYDYQEIHHLASGIADKTDATFVDVGANIGYYSLNLARLGYKRLIAIEPNPPTIERLKFNIEANGMDQLISVVTLCIGSGEEVPFYSSGELGSASVFNETHTTAKPIMVPTKPLIDILSDQGVARIDGLKIDIEGFEDRCLIPFFESAPKSLWPKAVVIELCHKHLWEKDITEIMQESGYQVANRSRANLMLRLA